MTMGVFMQIFIWTWSCVCSLAAVVNFLLFPLQPVTLSTSPSTINEEGRAGAVTAYAFLVRDYHFELQEIDLSSSSRRSVTHLCRK